MSLPAKILGMVIVLLVIVLAVGLILTDVELHSLMSIHSTGSGGLHTRISSMRSALVSLTLIALLALLVSCAVMYLMARRLLTLPLRNLVSAAQQIAAGQLTLSNLPETQRQDELGVLATAFVDMAANLKRLVGQVAVVSEQLGASSQQLFASAEETTHATESVVNSIQEMAAGGEEQAAEVSRAADTITEISGHVAHIAERADDVTATVRMATELAEQGNRAVLDTIAQMNAISKTVNGAAASVTEMGELAQSIGRISQAITAIADQTNLLALNATIEAARAGDQGRGFAVVAAEIRSLSEQSRSSAAQISQTTRSVQEAISRAVHAMASGTSEVAAGLEVVQVAGRALDEILHGVQRVEHQIGGVMAAVKEVNEGTAQVRQGMQTVSHVVQAAASGIETISTISEEQLAAMQEITASANAMAQMAQNLQASLRELK